MENECKKKQYEFKKDALYAIIIIKQYGEKRYKTPERVYLCDKCNKWHLTSMKEEKSKGKNFKLEHFDKWKLLINKK